MSAVFWDPKKPLGHHACGEELALIQGSIAFEQEDVLRIERTLLKDSAAELLRDFIISGRVQPGAKLVERQLSAALGVSRMPIRAAMVVLEQQGLVVSRGAGRYVIEVSDSDARQLNQVRSVNELLAAELAAANIEEREVAALKDALALMGRACKARDRAAFICADVDIHDLIWKASGNRYLQETLTNIRGPLLVAISNSVEAFDWTETLAIHAELVRGITTRDRQASLEAIRKHMESITR